MKQNGIKMVRELLLRLKNHNDNYSIELKKVLKGYINEPKGELLKLIDNIPLKKNETYNSLYNVNINILLSEILYPVS